MQEVARYWVDEYDFGRVEARLNALPQFVTEIDGQEAHSGLCHQGVNAVMIAGELLGEINAIAREMRERGDPTGRFDPPYTSVHVGTIAG